MTSGAGIRRLPWKYLRCGFNAVVAPCTRSKAEKSSSFIAVPRRDNLIERLVIESIQFGIRTFSNRFDRSVGYQISAG
jgi:hypothetical protein